MTSHVGEPANSADTAASGLPTMTVAAGATKGSAASGDTKKRNADEAALNRDDIEEKKLQARREANRMHAFKSRQRSKMLLAELQSTVEQLSSEKQELERHNAVLRAQVEVLHQQNLTLLQNQQQMILQQQQQQQQQPPPQQAVPGAATGWPSTAPTSTTPNPAPATQQQQPPPQQQPQQAKTAPILSPPAAPFASATNPFMAGLSQLAAANPSLMMAAAAAGMMGALREGLLP